MRIAIPPGTRFGAYEVLSAIGAGGMGEVYRARDTNLNRDVALKILPESFAADADRVARFKREAQVLASLNHPNIAAIYGLAETTSEVVSRALVMELVEGEDLSTLIDKSRALETQGALRTTGLPLADALPIARQITDALEAAHEQGIVHRDLKPQNIKVRADGTVKVLDFGLAKAMDTVGRGFSRAEVDAATMTSPAMTAMGMILGTAAYMSPEQARGRPVDRRADIWAFGVVLYEMLTGRRAFDGDDISITLANVLKEDVSWAALPDDMPPSVHRLLRRCLEKDPKRRLSSIGDARLELDDTTPAPSHTSPLPPAPRPMTIVPWIIAAVAIVIAMVAGWVALNGPAAATEAIWTSIAAPVSDFSRGLGPAVSPDGQRIAFVASNAAGSQGLWTRALGAQSAQLIAGTDGAGFPFWSPDGQSIAFFKDEKLVIIPADGGTVQVLADAVNNRGGTWNRDGVIVFVPATGLGLHKISVSAGSAATPLDTAAVQAAARPSWPSFLPDGQRFLYTSVRDGKAWITVGSVADSTRTPILEAVSRAQFADGYLLFGSKGGLYAQPFDPVTLTLSGERVRVLDSLGQGAGNTQNYSYSASTTGQVLVAGNTSFIPASELVWFDHSGARVGTLGDGGQIWGLRAAPDRTRILVEVHDSRANSIDPWVTQIDSGFSTPLRPTGEGALASSPIWSHDGKRVYFSNGYGAMDVVTATGDAVESWSAVGPHWPADSSPDGQVVLIEQERAGTGADLMLVSTNGSHTPTPYLDTSFNERLGRFSPTGASVAYVSDESGRQEVYIQSFPRSAIKTRISVAGGTQPQWSEDGREVYFLEVEGNDRRSLMARPVDRSSSPRRLLALPGVFEESGRTPYAVFDKGRRFLVKLLVPATAPQVITVGHNWTAGLAKR